MFSAPRAGLRWHPDQLFEHPDHLGRHGGLPLTTWSAPWARALQRRRRSWPSPVRARAGPGRYRPRPTAGRSSSITLTPTRPTDRSPWHHQRQLHRTVVGPRFLRQHLVRGGADGQRRPGPQRRSEVGDHAGEGQHHSGVGLLPGCSSASTRRPRQRRSCATRWSTSPIAWTAASPQVMNGTSDQFVSWSDAGAAILRHHRARYCGHPHGDVPAGHRRRSHDGDDRARRSRR